MRIIGILVIMSLLLISCAHVPQPPSYGPKPEKRSGGEHWRLWKPGSYWYYLKCEDCGVIFKSGSFKTGRYPEVCPECMKQRYGKWVNVINPVVGILVFILLSPLLILVY